LAALAIRTVTVASPCTQACRLDAAGTACAGCLRTLDEIGRWRDMSDSERQRVVDDLPRRQRRKEGLLFQKRTA
jgi:predicted Fe-S protein YdhL (DUF1289 family)